MDLCANYKWEDKEAYTSYKKEINPGGLFQVYKIISGYYNGACTNYIFCG